MKVPQLICISLLMLSCSSKLSLDNEDINIVTDDVDIILPVDDEISQVKPIYNQAYQENYEADNISYIIENAQNAYVLMDPFSGNSADYVQQIKLNNNQVAAYISIGTGEEYREDFEELRPFLVDTPWDSWSDEYFVNSTTTGILDIMKQRIDKIANWGFDWVEFDNMDWIFDDQYREEYGFQVTQQEGINYYNALCAYANSKGLKCMAKNTVTGTVNFDGVLYESFEDNKNWWDTSGTQQFLSEGKLVIINHYNESDCDKIYNDYKDIYNENLSFICESSTLRRYVHYNQ